MIRVLRPGSFVVILFMFRTHSQSWGWRGYEFQPSSLAMMKILFQIQLSAIPYTLSSTQYFPQGLGFATHLAFKCIHLLDFYSEICTAYLAFILLKIYQDRIFPVFSKGDIHISVKAFLSTIVYSTPIAHHCIMSSESGGFFITNSTSNVS